MLNLQMNFQKLIAYPESEILSQKGQKNMSTYSIYEFFFQKLLNSSKTLRKTQTLCKCFDRHMCM